MADRQHSGGYSLILGTPADFFRHVVGQDWPVNHHGGLLAGCVDHCFPVFKVDADRKSGFNRPTARLKTRLVVTADQLNALVQFNPAGTAGFLALLRHRQTGAGWCDQ
jgi:hypothetical protein